MHASQVTISKISETSKRLGRCYSSLSSKIHKATLANCMKDLRSLTEDLFRSNGANYIHVLDQIDAMEHVVIALERHIKEPMILEETNKSDSYHLIKSLITQTSCKRLKYLFNSLYRVIVDVKEWESQYFVQYQLWLEKQQLSKLLSKSADQFT